MNERSNTQQIEYWNGPAGERWASLQERIDLHLGDITDALLEFAAPVSGERMLDVGCGCGTTTFLLAMRAGPDGSVAGIDISGPMLNVARARASAQNANVALLEADASSYEFQPVFDLVLSRFGIMFFADPLAAFTNLRRAIVPSGRLVFACWRAPQENIWASAPLAAAGQFLPPQEPQDPLAPGPFAFADGDRLHRILREAGFRSVSVEHLDSAINMGATAADAAMMALNIGPLARAATGLDENLRAKIRAAAETALSRYAMPAGVFPPAACWLVQARS